MLPDTNLFRDMNVTVDNHVRHTEHLKKEDPRKFSISTIKQGVHAYLRILEPTEHPEHGSPPSSRICEDIHKWLENLWTIYHADGVMVRMCGDRNGRRKQMMEPTQTRGGSQTKCQGNSLLNKTSAGWMHDDAAHFSKWFFSESKVKFEGKSDDRMY